MWYCLVIGAFFSVVTIIPVLPWRYARVDTNVGNRFVMERYYNLMGCSNNLGKNEGWMALRKKMQRKVEEFGRPSPLSALIGTATQSLGAGGAAAGCMSWQACKEHVGARFLGYSTVAYAGIACMIMFFFGACMALASTVYLGFEQAAVGKKKKKKKGDECMEPATKTMALAWAGFMFTAGATATFTQLLGGTLKDFQSTAYYPFAGSHAAPFVGGAAGFLMWVACCVATNRAYHCCDKKKPEEGEGEGYGEGYPPGPYGAPGPYGPPGPYGAPPGAYGAPPQQW